MSRIKRFLIVLFLFLYLGSHLLDLHTGLTVDEPNWIGRSRSYVKAVLKLNFDSTYQAPHPGVTTMIAGGSGLMMKKTLMILGIIQPAQSRIMDIVFGRFGVFIANSFFLFCIYYLLSRKFKKEMWALFSLFLITLEPYLIGLSRILHVDTFLSYPLVIAVLLFLLYLLKHRKHYLIASSFFLALAFLTKTPAIFFIPFSAGLIILFAAFKKAPFWISFQQWIIGGILSCFFIFLIWPKLWVNPVGAFKYMFTVTNPEINKLHRLSEANPNFYFDTIYNFISPVYLILFILSAIVFIHLIRNKKKEEWLVLLSLHAFTLGYIIFMSMVTKKGERYIMPSMVMMGLIAAYTLDYFISMVRNEQYKLSLILVSVLLISSYYLWHMMRLHPYYLSYYNPWITQERANRIGLGEGLDLAAEYLNSKDNASSLTVSSWYSSSFAYYFKGKTYDTDKYRSKQIQYLVVYRNMYGREENTNASAVLSFIKDKKPEKTFYINSLPYVWVYKLN